MARQAQRPIKGHPAHEARVDKRSGAASHLPYPFVVVLPVYAEPVEDAAQVLPEVVRDRSVMIVNVDGVHQFPIDVELALLVRAVADTHRSALTVAFEVIERNLCQLCAPVNGVHWL